MSLRVQNLKTDSSKIELDGWSFKRKDSAQERNNKFAAKELE